MSRNVPLLSLAILTLGCSGQSANDQSARPVPADQGADTQPATSQGDEEKVIALWDVEGKRDKSIKAGATASFTGKLALQQRCLTVVDSGGHTIQPVFAWGDAQWDANAKVLNYLEKRYSLGQTISLGGGGVNDQAAARKQADVSIPECGNADLYFVAG